MLVVRAWEEVQNRFAYFDSSPSPQWCINYMKQILDMYRNDGLQFVYIPLLVRGSE